MVTAREAEPSPHYAGRAQPGDVLGVETGGERTYIGDTSEDENKRRIEAERFAGDQAAVLDHRGESAPMGQARKTFGIYRHLAISR